MLNPNNLPVVNHIDGNKANPIWTNLEWCTLSDNTKHAVKNHLLVARKGIDNTQSRPVLQLDKDDNIIQEFSSVTEAAMYLGNYNYIPNITRVCNNIRHTCKGYKWKYKN